ncbi:MAG: hypothetical protein ACRC2T_16685, partial [Thermoguttaceae bacterium]
TGKHNPNRTNTQFGTPCQTGIFSQIDNAEENVSEQIPQLIEELDLSENELKVINLIETCGTPIDTVIVESGLPTGTVLATLSALEMQHLVRRQEGNMVCRLH